MKVYLLTSCIADDRHDGDLDVRLDLGTPYLSLEAAQAAANEEANYCNEDESVELEWEGDGPWGAEFASNSYWRIRVFDITK